MSSAVLPRPGGDGPGNLVELLRHRAATQPTGVPYRWMVEGEGEPVPTTHAQLDRQARMVAQTLQERVAPGARVLLVFPPGLEYVAAFFGCLYAGVTAVPVLPPRPNKSLRRLQSIIHDVDAAAVISVSAIAGRVLGRREEYPDLAQLPWLVTDGEELADGAGWTPPELSPSTVAFLQYTSGATRKPRGVRVTHGNLVDNAGLIQDSCQCTAADHSVFWLPVYHDMGLIGGVLEPLWLGASSTLMAPAAFLQKPVRWLQAISTLGATISAGPNMAYGLCARQVTEAQKDTLDLSGWRVAFCGSEPINKHTLDSFAAAFARCGFNPNAFQSCYGMAEATLLVAGGRRGQGIPSASVDRAALQRGRVEPCAPLATHAAHVPCAGRPMNGAQVLIVDPDTHQVLPERRVGEMWLCGASVADGYHAAPEANAQAFVTVDGHDGLWFRTADLGWIDDGNLFFGARLPDVIRVDGRVLFPQDLERTAEAVDTVLRPGFGAAFQTPGARGRAGVVLVFEQERHRKPDMAALGPAVAQALRQVHNVELQGLVLIRMLGIPTTTSGKIQRGLTRDALVAATLPVTARWDADGFAQPQAQPVSELAAG